MGLTLGETETRSDEAELEIPIIKVSTSRAELSVIKIPVKRFISGVSPDGRYLALEGGSGKGGNALFIWDMQNRRFLEPVFQTPSFYPAMRVPEWAVFSPDAKLMAAHSHLNDNIYLWDLDGSQMFCREIKGIAGDMGDLKLALDNDGKVLVSLDSQNKLVFWDVTTLKALDIKKELPDNLEAKDIIFTRDGRLIALVLTKVTEIKEKNKWGSSFRYSYRLWDVQEAKFISPETEIDEEKCSLTRDGQVLTRNGILWDLQTQKELYLTSSEDRMITGISLSPNKKLLAWTTKRGSEIELWDVAQRKPLESLPSPGDSRMGFSPDGKSLIDLGNKELTFWDLATRKPWTMPLEDSNWITWSLTFSGNGKVLAVAGTKGKDPESKIGIIKLYNLDTASWPERACHIANRNLTREEWRQFLGDLPYEPVCAGLPVPEEGKEAK